jgi:hypothetical protein
MIVSGSFRSAACLMLAANFATYGSICRVDTAAGLHVVWNPAEHVVPVGLLERIGWAL